LFNYLSLKSTSDRIFEIRSAFSLFSSQKSDFANYSKSSIIFVLGGSVGSSSSNIQSDSLSNVFSKTAMKNPPVFISYGKIRKHQERFKGSSISFVSGSVLCTV